MGIGAHPSPHGQRRSHARGSVLSLIPGELLVCDGAGTILDLSTSAVRRFGLGSRGAALGRPLRELVAPEDRERVMDWIRRLHPDSACDPVHFHALAGEPSGTFPVEARGRLQAGPEGTGGVLLLLLHDDSRRLEAERALQESDTLQRTLMENLPVGVFIVDPGTRLVEAVNQQAAAWFGADRREILGRRCHAFVCPASEDQCPVCDLHREVDNSERILLRADGTRMPILKSVKRIQVGGREKLLEGFVDITERKQAERALLESSQRFQLAALAAGLAVWEWDPGMGTLIWDDRMFELHGLDRMTFQPTFLGWIRDRVHPEDGPSLEAEVRAALAEGRPLYVEFRVVHGDGTFRHLRAHATVSRDSGGTPVRMIGVMQDRTAQEEAESERKQLQNDLHHAEKLESVGGLAGGVAHDMNNVLAAILLSAEKLRESFQDDARVAKTLDSILHAGDRGKALVQALTDFARKGLRQTLPFDLNAILRQEVALLRRTTLQRVEVTLDLDPSLPPVLGDVSELGSVIMNLSVNALDAMPQGGALRFRSRSGPDGMVSLEVADSGCGMDAAVRAKAIDPFFTTKPIGQGTGLGLARVYGTIKAHGGSLDIQSEPGIGTTVTIRLPGAPPGTVVQGHEPAAERETIPSLKILLVDDDGLILDAVAPMLEAMGHQVELTGSGEEALRRLLDGPEIDLVLLDYHMPGLNGFETLERLRVRHPGLPVILSSGFLDGRTRDLLAAMPRVGILMKPYRNDNLRLALAAAVRS